MMMITLFMAALAAAAPATPTQHPDDHAQPGQHQQSGHKAMNCCDHGTAGQAMDCCKDRAEADKAQPCCAEHAAAAQAGHTHR